MTTGDAAKVKDAREAVEKKVDVSDNAGWSFSSSGPTITWSLNGSTQRLLAESATEQALKIIDNRINAIGVAEPTLQRHGGQNSHQILLQMPGIQDPEHVKKRNGAGNRSLSYIEGWLALDEANRIFGHGNWSRETVLIEPRTAPPAGSNWDSRCATRSL